MWNVPPCCRAKRFRGFPRTHTQERKKEREKRRGKEGEGKRKRARALLANKR